MEKIIVTVILDDEEYGIPTMVPDSCQIDAQSILWAIHHALSSHLSEDEEEQLAVEEY